MKMMDEDADYHLKNSIAPLENEEDKIHLLLNEAIDKLPEKQKLVFNMRYFDDLPYEEISQIVDMSVGTLKTNYHYAKQKIEEYIIENANH
jgi:RNA polymerase sigma-70 factor (ECF subfamily)